MVDVKKLDERLKKLRGLDFEEAERLERQLGNNYPVISFSSKFQARLAASALEVVVEDIEELPIKEYNRVIQTVQNFLFSNSDETETQSNS